MQIYVFCFLQSFSAIIRYRANDNHHSTFLLTIFDRSTDDEKYKKTHESSVGKGFDY